MKRIVTANRAALGVAAWVFMVAGMVRADEATTNTAWETSTSLGLVLTRGNSDTLLFAGKILTEKKKDKYELSLGANATYGESDGEKNNESYGGFGQYNRLLTTRFYAYGRIEALHDAIADVDYRFTISPGVGYYLVKSKCTSLSVESGPGVVIEKLGDDSSIYPTLRVAEKFEHKINDHVRMWQNAEFLPNLYYSDKFVVNAEAGVESGLTKKSSLRVYVQDSYYNEPADGRQRNDMKLICSIAWKF